MRKILVPAFAVLLAAGCATAYKQPERVYRGLTLHHNLSDDEARALVANALAEAGYTVSPESPDDRLITEPRAVKLTSSEADCGSTLGVYHVDQAETVTEVSFEVPVRAGEVEFRTHIAGHFLRGNESQEKNFTCASTGALERELSAAVKRAIEGR